jgi:tetratricopeptide (TPR) repeat protein
VHPGHVVADRFVIEARAGAGGMATVYRAHDRASGTIVALKLLGELAERERFVREAEMLAHLDHPSIVRYVAHGELESGVAFLAMEWLDGESLAERLRRESLSVDDALALAAHIARALGHAHARGIVHRDVKPSNIMLPGGTLHAARVLDFGVARHDVRRDLTQTGMLVGTPGYMSPEQARGSRDIDARADVFALGCLLYKALTQRAPFGGGTAVAVLAKILLEDPAPVQTLRADIPNHVGRVVMTLLAKDPDARPSDGTAAALVLEAARSEQSSDASLDPPFAASLTSLEQRMLSILLLDIGAPPGLFYDTPGDIEATATLSPLAHPVRDCALLFGAMPEPLADGSILIAFRGGSAEQTTRAAKCALAITHAMQSQPECTARGGCLAVLGTGRAVVDGGVPVGDLVDRIASLRTRATRLHARTHASLIVVDGVSATLLEERFVLSLEDELQVLGSERDGGEPIRKLLGRPSPCVGRDRELGELFAAFDECIDDESPRAALLKAPSGFGKSRVRYELVARIRDRAQVWMGRGDPMSAGAPFDLMTQAIRRAYGIRGDEPQGIRTQKLASRVARHVPEALREHTTDFIGEILSAPREGEPSARLRAARADPVLMGDQIRAAIQTLLRFECAAYPLVLVLEDLHWGDIPTVKLVDALLRDLSGCAFFVLATARNDIDDLFPKLWEDHPLLVLPLRELGRKPAEALVRAVLGDPTDDVVRDLVARAGGNAFYLEELIRAVAQGDGAALPETVLAVVSARLDKLDPEARRVLRAASVFGQAFWLGGVTTLTSGDAGGWIESLVAEEIVQRRPESRFDREPELVFRHAFLRDAAYAMLTDADRETGHRLAGAWLVSAGETNAVTLAEHFERGGERTRAAKFWERAAEQSTEGSDLARTIELATRGLACEPDAASRAHLHVLRSEAHRWRADLTQARSDARLGMECADESASIWYQAVAQLAHASISIGDLDAIVILAERLCERRPKPEDAEAYLVALSRVATSLTYGGHPDLAGRVYEKMDETLANGLPSEGALARVRLSVALRALRLKDDAFTLVCFGAALEVFERIGDRRGGMYVRVNLGVIHMELGDFERAERDFHEAIEAGLATGVTSIVVGGRINLGLVRALLGAEDEGLALVRGAQAEYEKLGDDRMMGIARTYAALIMLARGDVAAAEVEAASAADALVAIATSRADALGTRARALLILGRAEEALVCSSEAYAVLVDVGSVDDGDVRTRLAHIESLLATHHEREGRAILRDTVARLETRAKNLREPELRKLFLERVPENVRVMELALQLQSQGSH